MIWFEEAKRIQCLFIPAEEMTEEQWNDLISKIVDMNEFRSELEKKKSEISSGQNEKMIIAYLMNSMGAAFCRLSATMKQIKDDPTLSK